MIGGALARPCISYPYFFSKGTIWDKYPYLLPNVFSAVTVFCGVAIGVLFLEETHERKKHHRDAGIELGKRISSWFTALTTQRCQVPSRKAEKQPLLEEFDEYDELPGYMTTEGSPELASMPAPEAPEPLDLEAGVRREEGNKIIFTKPVILNIISYGILAL
jgi:hypothetical protein